MKATDRLFFVLEAFLSSALVGLFTILSSNCNWYLFANKPLKTMLFKEMNFIIYEWAWQILSIAVITIISFLISRKKDNSLEVAYKALWWSVVASLLYNLVVILI